MHWKPFKIHRRHSFISLSSLLFRNWWAAFLKGEPTDSEFSKCLWVNECWGSTFNHSNMEYSFSPAIISGKIKSFLKDSICSLIDSEGAKPSWIPSLAKRLLYRSKWISSSMSPNPGARGISIRKASQLCWMTSLDAWPRTTAMVIPIIFRIWCNIKLWPLILIIANSIFSRSKGSEHSKCVM